MNFDPFNEDASWLSLPSLQCVPSVTKMFDTKDQAVIPKYDTYNDVNWTR